MEIQDFIGIAVVGGFLSLLIQIFKNKYGDSNGTKLLTIGLSLFVGGLYVWIRSTSYFETVLLVLTSASAVYALLLKD